MFHIQPTPGTINLAQVSPPERTPADLDVAIGKLHCTSGVPIGVGGWEVDNLNEWYMKIIPGDCICEAFPTPFDEPKERVIASDFLGTDPSGRQPSGVDNINSQWITRSTLFSGSYITYTTSTLGRGEVGVFVYCEHDYYGWELTASFPTNGDSVEMAYLKQWDPTEKSVVSNGGQLETSYEYWAGVKVVRDDDEIVYSHVVSNSLGTVSEEITRFPYTSPATVLIGACRYPSVEASSWIMYNNAWEGTYEFPVNTYSLDPTSYVPASISVYGWRSPVVTLKGTTQISGMTLMNSGLGKYHYTIPDQYYGTAGDTDGSWYDSYGRYRIREETPSVVGDKTLQVRYAISTLLTVTLNSVAVTIASISTSDRRITMPSVVSSEDSITITYTHQDISLAYRGYLDDNGEWHDCDLNPLHPWSPLHANDSIYIYLKPVESVLFQGPTGVYLWGNERRTSVLYHTLEPINLTTHQLIAIISLRDNRLPTIIDMRTLPQELSDLGAWNRNESFGGPAYSEGGTLVVDVASGMSVDAYDAAKHAAAAGIRILTTESGDTPLDRLGTPS